MSAGAKAFLALLGGLLVLTGGILVWGLVREPPVERTSMSEWSAAPPSTVSRATEPTRVAPPAATDIPPEEEPPNARGGVQAARGLGERCSHDCQCESRECKGFRCVRRNLVKHPILASGAQCIFAGDCASCSCVQGNCQ